MSLAVAAALSLVSHIRFARIGGTIAATVATASASLTSNVATIVTGSEHGLYVGATVTISGMTATTYNVTGTVVAVPSTTSFTLAITHANISSAADTGGTVTQSGTVSDTVKPIATADNWLNLGDVEEDPEYDAQPENNLERIKPVQGQLVRVIQPGPFGKPMVKFKTSQMIDFAAALALSATPPTSGTQFNPQSNSGAMLGWLKLIHVDSSNVNRLVGDQWGVLSLDGPLKPSARDFTKPSWKHELSFSTLNTFYVG